MLSATQCLERSDAIYRTIPNCPIEALKNDLSEMADMWKRMAIAAAYQDGMDAKRGE